MRGVGSVFAVALLALSSCYLTHRGAQGSEVGAPEGDDDNDDGFDPAIGPCAVRTYQVGEKFEPIDMVWVVDSSRSMADEQARIEQTINQFVDDIGARNFDVRLVMITASNIVPPPLGTDAERYRFIAHEVGSHEPLQALLDELPVYQDFLRPSAALHFVVVTDDDSALSTDAFLDGMNAGLKRPFIVHAIASPDIDGAPCQNASPECEGVTGRRRALCGASAIGTQYYALAERLGGEEISICIDDWSMVFGPLLDAVGRIDIPCQIDLPQSAVFDPQVEFRTADGNVSTLERVDGAAACGERRAFYVLRSQVQTQLALCPVACGSTTTAGAELRVAAGCGGQP